MLVGKTLRNRYKILQVLGSGGFGDTYLAQDIDLPGFPICVVKQLKPKDTNPSVLPIAKSLFEREAEYLYKLGNAHPQIPKLFAHFEENHEFFLVEEFVDGQSLAEEIPIGHKLSENATIGLLIEILEVLSFVHQQNVIHRDIKLANLIRRRQDGKIVLIDFGAVKDISALGTDSQGNTSLTVSIGSPGYMPSEQARGKPRLSSDVYAVGMIGIQALTGIAPDSLQEDANTGEILWRDRVQVSNAFAEILQNMVFCHFNQRYKSAIEALHAMQSLTATNINNIANVPPINPPINPLSNNLPNEAIAQQGSDSSGSPTVVTNTNSGGSIPSVPTTPQISETTPHVTIPAPMPSATVFRPIVWIALIGLTSVVAAIATALLLPKLGNRQIDTSSNQTSKTEATTSITPSASPSEPPIVSPSPETPEPTPTSPETPPVVETSKPTTSSFGAIARSPSTQSKGYAWNYISRKAAEARALSECEISSNSGDCEILIWARNACMSLAEGSNGAAGSGWSEDMAAAERTAKQVCRQYQGVNCKITRTICLPVR